MTPTRPIRYPWPYDANVPRELVKQAQRHLRPPGILDAPGAASVTNLPGRSVLISSSATGAELKWFQMLTDAQVTAAIAAGDLPGGTLGGIFCRVKSDCDNNVETYDSPSGYGWPNEAAACQTERATTNPPELVYFPALKEELCNATPLNCPESVPDPLADILGDDRLVLAFWNETNSRWEAIADQVEGDIWDNVMFCPPYRALDECYPCDNEIALTVCCLFDGRAQRVLPSCNFCEPNNDTFDVWIFCPNTDSLAGMYGFNACYPMRRVMPEFRFTYELYSDAEEPGPTGVWVTDTRPVYAIGVCECGCPLDSLSLKFFTEEEGLEDPPEEVVNACTALNGLQIDLSCVDVVDLTEPGDPPSCHYQLIGGFCTSWRIPVYLRSISGFQVDKHDGGGTVGLDALFIQPDCETGEAIAYWVSSQELYGCCDGYYPFPDSWEMIDTPSPADVDGCTVLREGSYISGEDPSCVCGVASIVFQNCDFCYRVKLVCEDGGIISVTIQHVLPSSVELGTAGCMTATLTFDRGMANAGDTPDIGDSISQGGITATIASIVVNPGTSFAANDATGTIVLDELAGGVFDPLAEVTFTDGETAYILSQTGPILLGDPESMSALPVASCLGRAWWEMDMNFGQGYQELGDGYGFPHLQHHLFGGCCMGVDDEGECSDLPCGCCLPEDPTCACTPTITVELTWNCRVNQSMGGI